MSDPTASALSVHWTYGFSKDVPNAVHSLSNHARNAIFFLSSHSGVIYDFEERKQLVLQGHCNNITSCCVSKDKRWIVTADSGYEPILVVWDSTTGAPVKTIFNPHKNGICSVDISDDSLYLVTIGTTEEGSNDPQEICVWTWTTESEKPLLQQNILASEYHHTVRFNPSNQSEIVTTGSNSVCFWSWDELVLEGYVAKINKTEIGHFSGKFKSTIFLAGTFNAVTCTSDGYTILWEGKGSIGLTTKATIKSNKKTMRTASKVLRLVECAINIMLNTDNGYLAIGCADGAVRFYDMFLRLEAWFEDLSAGPVLSLSLSIQPMPFPIGEAGAPGLKFWVPDFMVGTSDALVVGVESSCFDEVKAEDRRGILVLQGLPDDVSCAACSPKEPLILLGCYNGSLQIWDYELKLLKYIREFNSKDRAKTANGFKKKTDEPLLRPQCLAFEPTGAFIAVGFTSGIVRFLSGETYNDVGSFAPTYDTIVSLKFSTSGKWLAGYDSSNHILLWKKEPNAQQTASDRIGSDFVYIGRILSHKAPVIGIDFGIREDEEVFFSCSEDRMCIEYDLVATSISFGIVLSKDRDYMTRVDTSAKPSAFMWHPPLPGDIEERFIVANDEFKFKEFNADSKQCRRTTLTPTFGGPLTTLMPVKVSSTNSSRLYAYATANKIIGVGCFPLSGNPSEVIGIVAHPGAITSLCISGDGKYLFSTGGSDLSCNMWKIDHNYWPPSNEIVTMNYSYTNTMDDAYYTRLDGGKNGELHNDIIDYFYYCQIRAQGEDSMEPRNLPGYIPLEEVSSLMRAIGYYPSEEEVSNINNEVKYKTFMNNGVMHEHIGLNDFIRLYLNYRPMLPLAQKDIENAFEVINKSLGMSSNSSVAWDELKKILTLEGEAISHEDMHKWLIALLGKNNNIDDTTMFDAQVFSDKILGFE